jgi:hypothetical protein
MTTIDTTMTVGQLLEMLDPPPNKDTSANWEKMEAVLGRILSDAGEFYDDRDDRIGDFALAIAGCVVQADGIEERTAEDLLHNIGTLAWFLLNNDEVKLNGVQRSRLEQIKNSHPHLAEPVTAAAE